MQENIIQKLNTRAKKSLTLKEVKLNDINYPKTMDYLKCQKLLGFTEINKILHANGNESFPIGNIFEDKKGSVVGFMGAFYSKKTDTNLFLTLCNIHSWIVDKEYRNNSFYLLSPLLSSDINFTAFTPVKSLVGLLLKFDFNKHTFYYRTILNFKYFNLLRNNFFISLDSDLMKRKLNQNDLKKHNNYNKSIYIKFIIYEKYNLEYIFIIGTIIKKKRFNVLNIFYVSNEELFKNNWNSIKPIISRKFNVCFFSEYTFDKKKSFFPKNQLFNKVSKKDFFLRGKINLNPEDLLASDLIV
tara:strand:+ start:207 stop:1103 length:897 start_codon:yes stop_codon:yes gene_type:complete